MERNIGEIFEYNGEWYQCVEGNGCKNCTFEGRKCYLEGGTDDPIGECCYDRRRDNKDVVFKKLEKVGEPYYNYEKKLCQQYKCYTKPLVADVIVYIFAENNIVVIEIKQTKEDMEDNKLNLKPFDIQKAKEGKPACTRDGRKARIICFDRVDAKPILALIASTDGKGEDVFDYFVSGKRIANALESDLDLMMLPERKSGWVNIYRGQVYNTFEKAEEARKIAEHGGDNCLKTIKIDWEE